MISPLKIRFVPILIALLIAGSVISAVAQDQQITIRVDGLSCPFCAYGLEKKLKRLAGSENVRIDVEQGIAEIVIAEDKIIREEEIKKAVLDAGFTPKEMTYHTGKASD